MNRASYQKINMNIHCGKKTRSQTKLAKKAKKTTKIVAEKVTFVAPAKPTNRPKLSLRF